PCGCRWRASRDPAGAGKVDLDHGNLSRKLLAGAYRHWDEEWLNCAGFHIGSKLPVFQDVQSTADAGCSAVFAATTECLSANACASAEAWASPFVAMSGPMVWPSARTMETSLTPMKLNTSLM